MEVSVFVACTMIALWIVKVSIKPIKQLLGKIMRGTIELVVVGGSVTYLVYQAGPTVISATTELVNHTQNLLPHAQFLSFFNKHCYLISGSIVTLSILTAYAILSLPQASYPCGNFSGTSS